VLNRGIPIILLALKCDDPKNVDVNARNQNGTTVGRWSYAVLASILILKRR
jgi:hypothetical protein